MAAYDSERIATSAQWLAQLRWVAVVGQLVTIGAVAVPLRVDLPMTALLGMIGLTATTNAAFSWLIRRHRQRPAPQRLLHVLGALMLLDLLILTGMLSATGGFRNPFAVFYFVNLALCGVLLPARWAWGLAGVAVVAFGGLRCVYWPVEVLLPPGASVRPPWRLIDAGQLVAFSACAVVIVWFTTRLTSELVNSEDARRLAEDHRARSKKLEALGTLAAGAAHELATPLSTIAVVAKELQLSTMTGNASDETAADIELIRSEVDRCRAILDRMSTRTGEAPGETPAVTPVADLVADVVGGLQRQDMVAVKYEFSAAEATITAPVTALSQAIRAVVQNGLDASTRGSSEPAVEMVVGPALGGVEIAVLDAGDGMPPEVLERAGEPFFTTKPPGKGMGLGLFLARSVVEHVGGELRIESRVGTGSTVRVRLPAVFAGNRGRSGDGSAEARKQVNDAAATG